VAGERLRASFYVGSQTIRLQLFYGEALRLLFVKPRRLGKLADIKITGDGLGFFSFCVKSKVDQYVKVSLYKSSAGSD
jgi:hypothetical protein